MFQTAAKSAKVMLPTETLHSYLQLAFPFKIYLYAAIPSFLIKKYILFLYTASSSELAERQQQGSYNSKTGYNSLPLCCIYTAQAPHGHTQEPSNSNTQLGHDQKICAALCNRNIIMCSQLYLFSFFTAINAYCYLFHVTYYTLQQN